MSEFKIDFFELAFLAEACIPPSPIARAMFFNDLSDKYYSQMSQEERTDETYAYKFNDKYHVSRSRSINEDYIDCVFSLTAP